MPREGSFALASFGRIKKVQETGFAVGRRGDKSVALKRILRAKGWSIVCEAELGAAELSFCGKGGLLCGLVPPHRSSDRDGDAEIVRGAVTISSRVFPAASRAIDSRIRLSLVSDRLAV
jgi:hypothetical protein